MSIESGQPEIAQPERKRSARRGWIEFIIAVVLVLAAPDRRLGAVGRGQRAVGRDLARQLAGARAAGYAAADAGTEALRLRAEAALERVLQQAEQKAPGRVVALD